MSLLGWVVGAAILDEWGRCEEQERELEDRDRRIRESERNGSTITLPISESRRR